MISDSLKMKITAAVLSAIFSGSYISCAVIEAVSAMKKELINNEDISITASENKNDQVNDSDNKAVELTVTEISTNEKKAEVSSTVNQKKDEVSESTKKETAADETITAASQTETAKNSEETKNASEPNGQTTTVKDKDPVVTEAPKQSEASQPKQQQSKPAPRGAVPESSMRGDDYFNTCAFIGDSHINGLAYIVPEGRILAKNGLNISRLAESIPVGNVAALSPEHIYIMMGTNGVSWMNHSTMISDYTNYIRDLHNAVPSADIYVMSIPPVTSAKSSKPVSENGIPNSSIVAYNELVAKMCEENGWYFLDIHSAVADSSGCLTNDSTDGVHMPVGVYKNVVKGYLLSHVV